MALKALAFGPLPASQAQAAESFGQDVALAGAPSPHGLGGGGGAVDLNAPPDELSAQHMSDRLAPLYAAGAVGGVGGAEGGPSLSDLPGGEDVNFLSPVARQLGRGGSGAAAASAGGAGSSLETPGQPDFVKAIRAFQDALKLGKSGNALLDAFLGGAGTTTLSLAPSTLEGLGAAASQTGFAPLTAKGLGEATTGAGGAGSATSGLGGATAGGAGLTALLSILASATGNPDLGTAARAAGIGTGALGLANTGASLAGIISGLGGASAAGAAAGTAGAAAAGASAGFGTAAGAAASPIAIMLIADQISQLAGNEPVFDFGAMLEGLMGDYWKFAPQLGITLRGEGSGLKALSGALPYVGSQAELGNLLDLFRAQQAQRIGDYGAGTDRFTIPDLPGAGGSSHEGGITADFGQPVSNLNALIPLLRAGLPETGGPAASQLWNQLLVQGAEPGQAPLMVRMPDGTVQYMTPPDYAGWYNQMAVPLIQQGVSVPGYMENATSYGQPGYDYAGGGLLAPGAAPGTPSPIWQMLQVLAGGGG